MRPFRLAGILPLLALCLAAEKATVEALLAEGGKYTGQTVTVVAKVRKVESKTSRVGNDYFKFQLGQDKAYVNVYGMGKLPLVLKDGDTVEVTGLFRTEKRFRDAVYKNEIEVSKKLNPRYGVKKL